MLNKKTLVALSLSILLIGVIPMIAGQEERPQRERPEREEKPGFDSDDDDYVSYREFYAGLAGKLDDATIKRVFDAADVDEDGKLSERELYRAIELLKKLRPVDEEDDKDDKKAQMERKKRARMKKIAEKKGEMKDEKINPDTDGDGAISLREFYKMFGGKLDEATVKRIFTAADGDGNGELNKREMYRAWELIKSMKVDDDEMKDMDGCCKKEKEDKKEFKFDGEKIKKVLRTLMGIDANGDGEITLREIIHVLMKIGQILKA